MARKVHSGLAHPVLAPWPLDCIRMGPPVWPDRGPGNRARTCSERLRWRHKNPLSDSIGYHRLPVPCSPGLEYFSARQPNLVAHGLTPAPGRTLTMPLFYARGLPGVTPRTDLHCEPIGNAMLMVPSLPSLTRLHRTPTSGRPFLSWAHWPLLLSGRLRLSPPPAPSSGQWEQAVVHAAPVAVLLAAATGGP